MILLIAQLKKFSVNGEKVGAQTHIWQDEPLLADWFTGVLRVPKGKLLYRVDMGFDSIYAKELHIEIENGIVTRRWVSNNRRYDHVEIPVETILRNNGLPSELGRRRKRHRSFLDN